jgi:hypothetical protein
LKAITAMTASIIYLDIEYLSSGMEKYTTCKWMIQIILIIQIISFSTTLISILEVMIITEHGNNQYISSKKSFLFRRIFISEYNYPSYYMWEKGF